MLCLVMLGIARSAYQQYLNQPDEAIELELGATTAVEFCWEMP